MTVATKAPPPPPPPSGEATPSLSSATSASFPPTPPPTPAIVDGVEVARRKGVPEVPDLGAKEEAAAADEVGKTKKVDDVAATTRGDDEAKEGEEQGDDSGLPDFLRNLCILPPRQKKEGADAAVAADSSATAATGAVPLPPIRAEEPVASIRAALSEVIGYAHLTSYRLVLEKGTTSGDVVVASGASPASVSAAGGGGTDAIKRGTHPPPVAAPTAPSSSSSSSSTPGSSSTSGGKKGKKKKKGKGGGGGGSQSSAPTSTAVVAPSEVVSPYTLRNAVVSLPPAVRSLEVEPYRVVDDSGETKKDEEVETTLDDYGDLTLLLEKGLQTGSAFRVVLERYDPASVRDHVGRLRTLLDGNAPSVTSLAEAAAAASSSSSPGGGGGGDGNADGDEEAKREDGEDGGGTAARADAEGKKEVGSSSDKNGKKDQSEAVSEKDKEKNLRKSGRQSNRQSAAEQMPTFTDQSAVSMDGTKLSGFYYLSCGEEEAYRALTPKKDAEHVSAVEKTKKVKDPTQGDGDAAGGPSAAAAAADAQEAARRLRDLDARTRVAGTVQFSGFHPPPPHRRVLGDLAYLEFQPPPGPSGGEAVVHITAVPTGFYVNRTSAPPSRRGSAAPYDFDPTPADDPCFSHELLDCLLLQSKSFRAAWSDALAASKERADLNAAASSIDSPLQALHKVAVQGDSGSIPHGGISNGLDSVILRPPWLVPLPLVDCGDAKLQQRQTWDHANMHEYNPARAEDNLSSTFGLDIRGGTLRDWNEELQSSRELPTDSLQERIERARMVHKVLSDFGDAALVGAKAIFDGHVTPMNPNEPTRSHVYLHNNIFFSRAVDAGVDTFKIAQGDRAAKKSATRDAQCMGTLHRLDMSGLNTLATVLIDYLGTRLVCQSIVPGILHGEKSHTLLYGSVEATAPLAWDKDMHELLEKTLGKGCMVATRAVPTSPLSDERLETIERMKSMSTLLFDNRGKGTDEERPLTTLCGPVEAKGIRGSDQRNYVLDLIRLTPRDANWVPKSQGGTGRWEETTPRLGTSSNGNDIDSKVQRFIPQSVDDDEWTMAVLRPELVTNLTHTKMAKRLKSRKDSKESEKTAADADEDKKKGSDDPNKIEPSDAGKNADTEEKEQKKEASQDIVEKDLRAEDEEYLNSLRLNVNVFLPNTRSLEDIDNNAYEQMRQDEELVREASCYLWDEILPSLTKEIKDNSGHQIPSDGCSLTELLHQKGINCRYLGRLAQLASDEESKDRQAENDFLAGNAQKLPRRLMPLCWLEMLECEMVARAAKHVLDFYLTEKGGAAAAKPAQTVASFLSALMSTAEESAAETELREGRQDKQIASSMLDEEDMNSLTIFDTGGSGDAVPPPVRGRAEVWDDIEREVGRRFRYMLSLYNRASTGKDEQSGRALFTPLLRRVCQRTGVRLAARDYHVGRKGVCSGGISAGGRTTMSYPIAPVDVLDILPLIKHAASHSGEGFVPGSFDVNAGSPSLHILLPDAKATFEAAHGHWTMRALPQALELSQEASSLYQRVVETPLHASVARCLDLTSVILFQAQEPELAAANAARALAVAVQLGGFDCAEAVSAHSTLSHILISSGSLASGVKHLRAAQYLMELLAGPNFSELPNVYQKLGTMYHEIGDIINALRFYREAAKRHHSDRMVGGMIEKSSAILLAGLHQFKPAYNSEKRAYQIYRSILGDDHDLTTNSSNTLKQFMRLAVEQGKTMKAEEQKRREEEAADAVASQIQADEKAEEEKKKKKKKAKKTKKK